MELSQQWICSLCLCCNVATFSIISTDCTYSHILIRFFISSSELFGSAFEYRKSPNMVPPTFSDIHYILWSFIAPPRWITTKQDKQGTMIQYHQELQVHRHKWHKQEILPGGKSGTPKSNSASAKASRPVGVRIYIYILILHTMYYIFEFCTYIISYILSIDIYYCIHNTKRVTHFTSPFSEEFHPRYQQERWNQVTCWNLTNIDLKK